jgi:hypothetical protein
MKLRCPACGSVGDLGLFVESQASRAALMRIFERTDIGRAIVQYVGLHRPATRSMSDDRFIKLCSEVLADVDRGSITRDGRSHTTPPAAWIWAVNEALKARDNGKLALPLSGHGWIYAVLTAYKPELIEPPQPPEPLPVAVKPRPATGSDKPRWEQ